jgi:hypothetical protein
MTERERAEAEVAEKERALTDAFEAPGGDWYDVPPSMVREGFADTAEEGLRVLKDLLIGNCFDTLHPETALYVL